MLIHNGVIFLKGLSGCLVRKRQVYSMLPKLPKYTKNLAYHSFLGTVKNLLSRNLLFLFTFKKQFQSWLVWNLLGRLDCPQIYRGLLASKVLSPHYHHTQLSGALFSLKILQSSKNRESILSTRSNSLIYIYL